ILVGAPQARAQSQQLANRTGGLFACPIITEDDECDQVEIDNDVDLKRESKENQWMGVMVKSQGIGGKVVVGTVNRRTDLAARLPLIDYTEPLSAVGNEAFMLQESSNVRTEQLSHSLVHLGIYDDGPYEAGDERKQDANLIPVPANSYLGFSVDSAKGLTQQDELSVVSGAPRANHTGAVVILKKEGVNRLAPEHILWGEELGSSYGYAVATVDLNNDG
ncbi:hypothetical protein chiPu_0021198, partial [Chiloscyllium punctatum]|nr:hypothetical protein [Chiloscyllium punctatum]